RDGTTTQTTYNVSPDAVVTIDGQGGTLEQLVAGVKVSLKTDPKDAASVVSITAEGTQVHGMVWAVDTTAGTITLTSWMGSATTYTLGAATVEVNGVAATLADVTVGSMAEVTLSALDATVVVSVETRSMPSLGGQGHGPGSGGGPGAGMGGGMMGGPARRR
ncbi:MAG: hypothetical protein NT031_15905, partial [Planctomycetota bacterium]|nr:hypothetical protein [Planctomycetota bacterium]